MKDLKTLWKRYKKAEAKCETDYSGRNENPQQVGAATRAFKVFYNELKKQKGYTDNEATSAIITEWS